MHLLGSLRASWVSRGWGCCWLAGCPNGCPSRVARESQTTVPRARSHALTDPCQSTISGLVWVTPIRPITISPLPLAEPLQRDWLLFPEGRSGGCANFSIWSTNDITRPTNPNPGPTTTSFIHSPSACPAHGQHTDRPTDPASRHQLCPPREPLLPRRPSRRGDVTRRQLKVVRTVASDVLRIYRYQLYNRQCACQ